MKNITELIFKPEVYLSNPDSISSKDMVLIKNFLIYFLPCYYLVYLIISHLFNIYSCISWLEIILFTIITIIVAFIYSYLCCVIINLFFKNKTLSGLYSSLLIFYPGILIVTSIFITLFSFFFNLHLSFILFVFFILGILIHFIILFIKFLKPLDCCKTFNSRTLIFLVTLILIIINPLTIMSYLPIRYEVLDLRLVGKTDMNPTIRSKNIILIDKLSGYLRHPGYNDIVLVRNPIAFKHFQIPFKFLCKPIRVNDLYYIRRVIGKQGDSLNINSDSEIFLNNNKIVESYTRKDKNNIICQIANYCSLEKIDKNNYYLLGDNRNVSQDSRIWSEVNARDLKGKIYGVIWPQKDFKIFP